MTPKDKFINIFKNTLDEKEEKTFLEAFSDVDRALTCNLGDDDFEENNKDAICAFCEWFMDSYGKDEKLVELIQKTYYTSSPTILMVWAEIKNDKKLLERFVGNSERYDKYIQMFKSFLKGGEKEDIFMALSLTNIEFSKDFFKFADEAEKKIAESGEEVYDVDEFVEKSTNPVIVFYHWFFDAYEEDEEFMEMVKYGWDKLPFILQYAEDWQDDMNYEEEVDSAMESLMEEFNSAGFSDKKNITTIYNYIIGLKGEKELTFMGPKGEESDDPLVIPEFINIKNEYDEDPQKIEEWFEIAIKGRMALMIKEKGGCIWCHQVDDKLLICGVGMLNKTLTVLTKEMVDNIEVSDELNKNGVEIEYEEPNFELV